MSEHVRGTPAVTQGCAGHEEPDEAEQPRPRGLRPLPSARQGLGCKRPWPGSPQARPEVPESRRRGECRDPSRGVPGAPTGSPLQPLGRPGSAAPLSHVPLFGCDTWRLTRGPWTGRTSCPRSPEAEAGSALRPHRVSLSRSGTEPPSQQGTVWGPRSRRSCGPAWAGASP